MNQAQVIFFSFVNQMLTYKTLYVMQKPACRILSFSKSQVSNTIKTRICIFHASTDYNSHLTARKHLQNH
jgi:hypothetical protein